MPPVLLHHFKHNKVLHEQVVLLSVVTDGRARGAPTSDRISSEALDRAASSGSARATASCRRPTCRRSSRAAAASGSATDPEDTSYYLGRRRSCPTGPRADGDVAQAALRASCRATRARRPTSSGCRPTAWSSSGRRSSSDAGPLSRCRASSRGAALAGTSGPRRRGRDASSRGCPRSRGRRPASRGRSEIAAAWRAR